MRRKIFLFGTLLCFYSVLLHAGEPNKPDKEETIRYLQNMLGKYAECSRGTVTEGIYNRNYIGNVGAQSFELKLTEVIHNPLVAPEIRNNIKSERRDSYTLQFSDMNLRVGEIGPHPIPSYITSLNSYEPCQAYVSLDCPGGKNDRCISALYSTIWLNNPNDYRSGERSGQRRSVSIRLSAGMEVAQKIANALTHLWALEGRELTDISHDDDLF